MADITSKYDPYLSMLEFHDVNPLEAEKLAEKCFHAQAWLVKDLASAEYKELLLGDNVENVKGELLTTVPSEMSNAESRKAWVQIQPGRKEAFQKHAATKSQLEYLKRLLKLFESANYYYGGKARR